MSDMVERLAAKWAEHFGSCRVDHPDEGLFEADARFMMLAIAEELEAGDDTRLMCRLETARWLRSQAEGGR